MTFQYTYWISLRKPVFQNTCHTILHDQRTSKLIVYVICVPICPVSSLNVTLFCIYSPRTSYISKNIFLKVSTRSSGALLEGKNCLVSRKSVKSWLNKLLDPAALALDFQLRMQSIRFPKVRSELCHHTSCLGGQRQSVHSNANI